MWSNFWDFEIVLRLSWEKNLKMTKSQNLKRNFPRVDIRLLLLKINLKIIIYFLFWSVPEKDFQVLVRNLKKFFMRFSMYNFVLGQVSIYTTIDHDNQILINHGRRFHSRFSGVHTNVLFSRVEIFCFIIVRVVFFWA
jgi:hypothetical protein